MLLFTQPDICSLYTKSSTMKPKDRPTWGLSPLLAMAVLSSLLASHTVQAELPSLAIELDVLSELWTSVGKTLNCGESSCSDDLCCRVDRGGKVKEIFYIGQNFAGTIPSGISKFVSLDLLYMQGSGFVGLIPDLSLLTKLKEVQLQDQGLQGITGRFPTESLVQVRLNNNKMQGNCLDLTGMAKLEVAVMHSNQCTSFPNLSTNIALQEIQYQNNKIAGNLTTQFAVARPTLTNLLLYNNLITGPLFPLNKVPGVKILQLQNNRLTGPLPSTAAVNALSNLNYLDLSLNAFQGPMPVTKLPEFLFLLSPLTCFPAGIPTTTFNCASDFGLGKSDCDLWPLCGKCGLDFFKKTTLPNTCPAGQPQQPDDWLCLQPCEATQCCRNALAPPTPPVPPTPLMPSPTPISPIPPTSATTPTPPKTAPIAMDGYFTSPNRDFLLSWQIDTSKRHIRFFVRAQTNGYVCFGFLPQLGTRVHERMDSYCGMDIVTNGNQMPNPGQDGIADPSAQFVVYDMISDSVGKPALDVASNIFDIEGSNVDGVTLFSFSRPLYTADSSDVSLDEGNVLGFWAMHEIDNLNKLHNLEGVLSATFMTMTPDEYLLRLEAPTFNCASPLDACPNSSQGCVVIAGIATCPDGITNLSNNWPLFMGLGFLLLLFIWGLMHICKSGANEKRLQEKKFPVPSFWKSFITMMVTLLYLFDFSTDVLFGFFLYVNWDAPSLRRIYLLISIGTLVLPSMYNLMKIVRILRAERPLFWQWYHKHPASTRLICTLSVINLNCMSLLYSNLLGSDQFNAPMSSTTKDAFVLSSFFGVLVEDIPQLGVQIAVSVELGGFNTVAMVSVVVTILGLVSKLMKHLVTRLSAGNRFEADPNMQQLTNDIAPKLTNAQVNQIVASDNLTTTTILHSDSSIHTAPAKRDSSFFGGQDSDSNDTVPYRREGHQSDTSGEGQDRFSETIFGGGERSNFNGGERSNLNSVGVVGVGGVAGWGGNGGDPTTSGARLHGGSAINQALGIYPQQQQPAFDRRVSNVRLDQGRRYSEFSGMDNRRKSAIQPRQVPHQQQPVNNRKTSLFQSTPARPPHSNSEFTSTKV